MKNTLTDSEAVREAVRQGEHRRVCDPLELVVHGLVDQRVAVPMDVAPQRRNAIEIPLAVDVDQLETVASADDGKTLIPPRLHRREGMPQVLAIKPPQFRFGHAGSLAGKGRGFDLEGLSQ